MSYTVHWANEYFIISFVLNHLCILFSLSQALSLSLFSLTDRSLSLFSISPVTISLLLLLLLSLTDHYRTYASKPLPANPSHPCQQTFTSNPPYPMSTKHQNHGREKKKKKNQIRKLCVITLFLPPKFSRVSARKTRQPRLSRLDSKGVRSHLRTLIT